MAAYDKNSPVAHLKRLMCIDNEFERAEALETVPEGMRDAVWQVCSINLKLKAKMVAGK